MNLFSESPKEEFLEAVISAMRSVLQQLASKSIPQVHKLPNIGLLYVILKGDYSVLQCCCVAVSIFKEPKTLD